MVLIYGQRYCFDFWDCPCTRLDDGFDGASMEMKTPEELAEEFVSGMVETDSSVAETSRMEEWCLSRGFLAGYHSRDEEIAKLREEIAMLKAELKEVGND